MIGAGVIGLLGFLMMLAFMRDTPQSQGFLLDRRGRQMLIPFPVNKPRNSIKLRKQF